MHHQIDSLAYTNKLRYLPPHHKLIFAISLFCLGYVTANYLKVFIFCWLIVWTVIYAGIPWQVYRQLILIPVSFWLTSLPALIIGVSVNSSASIVTIDMLWGVSIPLNLNSLNWGYWHFYLSVQGFGQAIDILCNSLCLTACMYFIFLTIPFS